MADCDLQETEILAAIDGCGECGMDPRDLLQHLGERHQKAIVIEVIQRAIERGKISLSSDGMVVSKW